MAKRSANLIDLHAEKIVLGVCGLFLIGAGVLSFGGLRFQVDGRGPAALVEEAGTQATTTAQRIAAAQAPTDGTQSQDSKGDPAAVLQEWFGPQAPGLIRIAQVAEEPGRTQKFPPIRPEITGLAAEERRHLARIVAPGIPVVVTGRTLLSLSEPMDIADVLRSGTSTLLTRPTIRSFVSVAAQVDLVEQDTYFKLEHYPSHCYVQPVKVHLQRRDEAEPWRGWQDVPEFQPYRLPERPALFRSGRIQLDGLQAYQEVIRMGGDLIARPRLPGSRVSLPQVPYLDRLPSSTGPSRSEASTIVKRWTDLARKALAGKKPFEEKDLDAALLLARAAAGVTGAGDAEIQTARRVLDEVVSKTKGDRKEFAQRPLRAPERLMPLMAHDLDVLPGHTYVYRMRYEVLNLFAGMPGELRNPEDARRLTTFSDWSPESRPVTIDSDVYFFLTKADPQKRQATVKVYKKTRTGWKDEEYNVGLGESIGEKATRGLNKGIDFSTRAICVDLDFDCLDPAPGGKKTVRMVYIDPDGGQLRERYLSRDRKDKLIQQLTDQRTAGR